MHLFIKGVEKKQFNVEKVLIEDGQVLVGSVELTSFVNGAIQRIALLEADLEALQPSKPEAAPAAPTAPAAPVFEIVEAPNLPHTIEAFKASGWTEQQLLDAGHLIKHEVKSEVVAEGGVPAAPADKTPEPPAPSPAIKGQFELDGVTYNMSAKAAGADYEQFKANGWAIEALVSEGYATVVSGGKAEGVSGGKAEGVSGTATEEKTYPWMNADGDWEDSAGTVWTEAYSMGSNKVPPVTVKGLFKKSRAKAKVPAANDTPAAPTPGVVVKDVPTPADKTVASVPSAPAAGGVPSAPSASAANSVPSAPGAATIGGDDEPLDDELASIVKDWT